MPTIEELDRPNGKAAPSASNPGPPFTDTTASFIPLPKAVNPWHYWAGVIRKIDFATAEAAKGAKGIVDWLQYMGDTLKEVEVSEPVMIWFLSRCAMDEKLNTMMVKTLGQIAEVHAAARAKHAKA